VSDLPELKPLLIDPNVKNPWGIAFGPKTAAGPGTPLWVSNQNSNTITLYKGANGVDKFVQVPLVISAASPTGLVFNPTTSFPVPQAAGGTKPARFLWNENMFDATGFPTTEAITAWSGPGTQITPVVKHPGFYAGLTLVPADEDHGPMLLSADAFAGTIDAFDGQFKMLQLKKGAFVDPTWTGTPTPPYNVAYLKGRVYVTYAPAPGQTGTPAVSVFSTKGKFIKRLATGGKLAGPWGMAIAPEHWGDFGGALLVGNVDNGMINAYDPRSGKSLGTLRDSHGMPIVNLGLWGIEFGNGTIGTPETLIFAAGVGSVASNFVDVYAHGLVGLIEPVRHENDDN